MVDPVLYNREGRLIPPVAPVFAIDITDEDDQWSDKKEMSDPTITLTARELEQKIEMAKSAKLKEIQRDLSMSGWKLARGLNGHYQIRPDDD